MQLKFFMLRMNYISMKDKYMCKCEDWWELRLLCEE